MTVWLGLLAVGVVAIVVLSLWRSHRQSGRLQASAQKALDEIKEHYTQHHDDAALALALSAWLKRVVAAAMPDRSVAAATGKPWLEFLDRYCPQREFTEGIGQVFGDAVYAPKVSVDGDRLIALCERWGASFTRLNRGST